MTKFHVSLYLPLLHVCLWVAQLCPTFCKTMDYTPAGSSVHGFPRQEYWSGLLFPSPGDLPNPGIKPGSPALQADSSLSEPPGKPFVAYHWPFHVYWGFFSVLEGAYCVEVIFCVHLIDILCVSGPRYPCWPKLMMKDGFFKQATLVTEHIFLLRFFFFFF